MQPTLAFPSFFLGSPVGIASSSNSRFHRYFLGILTTWQATRPRVSTAFLCTPVSTASSANARYHFVRCVSIFRLWTSCRRDKQYTQAFSSFFLEARVTLAFPLFFLFRLSVWRAVPTHVSIFLSWAAPPRGSDKHSAHAFPLFFTGSPVHATLLVVPSKE